MTTRSAATLTRAFAAARSLLYTTGFVLLWWWVVASARAARRAGHPRAAGVARASRGWSSPGSAWRWRSPASLRSRWSAKARRRRSIRRESSSRWDPTAGCATPCTWARVAVICGAGLYLRSLGALVVAVFFILLMHAFVLCYEEPSLEARFGESYLRYKRSVARWLPRRRSVVTAGTDGPAARGAARARAVPASSSARGASSAERVGIEAVPAQPRAAPHPRAPHPRARPRRCPKCAPASRRLPAHRPSCRTASRWCRRRPPRAPPPRPPTSRPTRRRARCATPRAGSSPPRTRISRSPTPPAPTRARSARRSPRRRRLSSTCCSGARSPTAAPPPERPSATTSARARSSSSPRGRALPATRAISRTTAPTRAVTPRWVGPGRSSSPSSRPIATTPSSRAASPTDRAASSAACTGRATSDAGRVVGSGVVARLHNDPTFRADFEAARQELAAVRAQAAPALARLRRGGDGSGAGQALNREAIRVIRR